MCICVCVSISMSVSVSVSDSKSMPVSVSVCVSMFISVSVSVCIYFMYVCVCLCVCMCMWAWPCASTRPERPSTTRGRVNPRTGSLGPGFQACGYLFCLRGFPSFASPSWVKGGLRPLWKTPQYSTALLNILILSYELCVFAFGGRNWVVGPRRGA